jgi:predicted nucleic-acid-binding protein
MIGVDTNLLLRAFLRDDPVQTPLSERLLRSCTREQPARVALPVLAEFVWTLTRRHVPRARIIETLGQLLERPEIDLQAREAVVAALARYRKGAAGFVDYLIVELNRFAGASTTFTLDEAAGSEPGFTLLSP